VLNAVVLWNTRYLDAIVEDLRAKGYPVSDEDVARLSPLGHAHINLAGTHSPRSRSTGCARCVTRRPRRTSTSGDGCPVWGSLTGHRQAVNGTCERTDMPM
jgi:hypothetical protein